MTGDSQTASVIDGTALIARLERVPFSRWHLRPRIIVGSATFFDAFDALSLAFVLPVLVPLWGLSPGQIGSLISVGYLGQFLGALIFGSLAEAIGRIRAAAAAVAIMSVMSLGCALAPGFTVLLVCRFVQGVGVGGEMPVAAVYINELSKARGRGRFFLLYEMLFPIGLMMTGQIGAVLVPMFGWQVMFLIGGIPGLVITWLLLRLPESPRWLISKGRFAEAEAIVREMEEHSPGPEASPAPPEQIAAATSSSAATPAPRGTWTELLGRAYRRRTVVAWTLWWCAFFITNGLNNWMPTLYNRVYGLDLQQSLRAGTLTNVMQVIVLFGCAFVIDRTGRRLWTAASFATGALMLGDARVLRCGFGRRGDRAGDPELRHRRIGQCRAVSLHARDLSDADARHRHGGGDLLASSRVRGRPAAGRLHRRGGGYRPRLSDVRRRGRDWRRRGRVHARDAQPAARGYRPVKPGPFGDGFTSQAQFLNRLSLLLQPVKPANVIWDQAVWLRARGIYITAAPTEP